MTLAGGTKKRSLENSGGSRGPAAAGDGEQARSAHQRKCAGGGHVAGEVQALEGEVGLLGGGRREARLERERGDGRTEDAGARGLDPPRCAAGLGGDRDVGHIARGAGPCADRRRGGGEGVGAHIRDELGDLPINGFLTCGRGQKMGIFSGSGVGKSVLLGMISRYTKADVNVIALIGERGREVNEFLERDLGADALARSIVVVATSDQAPLIRLRAALVATTIAEYFRDAGQHVLLLMDSVTRLAYSQREVGLAIGEPPTTKGYTPSVFALLPQLLERVGTGPGPGTITGLYTVLVDGDDMNDPIADTVRSILDGHIVLSRTLAARNHFPAIDLLQSTSRVMRDIVGKTHHDAARRVLELMARYQQSEDLVLLGAYKAGMNAVLDKAVQAQDSINGYLRQAIDQPASLASSVQELEALARQAA